MTTNDKDYIDQILAGDTHAFSVLVDRYKDLVYTLAIRMVKHQEEAEEIAQDTFIKVYRSLEKFKGDSKLSTWIYRVAYNTCLDRIKRNKKFQNNVAIDEYTRHEVKSIDNALEGLEKQEQAKTIKKCIDALPSEDAFLMTLYYYEEQTLEEIADITGLKANNVKVKLFRSRKKLAALLEQHLDNETIESYGTTKRTALK